MQHGNLSRIAMIADVMDGEVQEPRLRSMESRSARTELALRELAKLQAQAVRLAAVIEANDEIEDAGPAPGGRCSDEAVRRILQARLARKSFFPDELFSDPAWDMLLDLYAAELGQLRVSVTSLCIASNAPTSTALRYISALEKEGLIERRSDPLDGRRFFMSLTKEAVGRFDRYFSALGNRSVI